MVFPGCQVSQNAKGWYGLKKGDIVLILANNTNVEDAQADILQEVLSHKGLIELSGNKFDTGSVQRRLSLG